MDEGTYTQRDFWNKEISTVKVAVTSELVFISAAVEQDKDR